MPPQLSGQGGMSPSTVRTNVVLPLAIGTEQKPELARSYGEVTP